MLDSTTNYDEDKLEQDFGGSLMDSITHENPDIQLGVRSSNKVKKPNENNAGDTLVPSDQASLIDEQKSVGDVDLSQAEIEPTQNTRTRQKRMSNVALKMANKNDTKRSKSSAIDSKKLDL